MRPVHTHLGCTSGWKYHCEGGSTLVDDVDDDDGDGDDGDDDDDDDGDDDSSGDSIGNEDENVMETKTL